MAIRNSDVLMGKGTGEARAGSIEMVLLPPVETKGMKTDQDIDRLVSAVRAAVAAELEAAFQD